MITWRKIMLILHAVAFIYVSYKIMIKNDTNTLRIYVGIINLLWFKWYYDELDEK